MARLALAVLMVFALIATVASLAQPIPQQGSVVKVVVPGGHGSGVHIGSGYLLTAAHVTAGARDVEIKLDDGSTLPGLVQWESREYDIALIRLKDHPGLAASHLSCRVPGEHEPVTARGNPLSLENITTRGWIAGGLLSVPNAWRSVVPMSVPIAGGMSGGGLFDASGNLIGILVGVPVQWVGSGGATFVGLSYAVDGLSICNLMARA